MKDFQQWIAIATADAQNRTKLADVSWLIGDEATMREFFDEDLDPEEYVDNCIADAAA